MVGRAGLVADDPAILERDRPLAQRGDDLGVVGGHEDRHARSLIRSSAWMISRLMTGSRLPVGSSAMMIRGSWTSARAIAVRCCSPPDSLVGSLLHLPGQPDQRDDPLDRGPDLAAGRAGDLERERDVLVHGLPRQQP